MISFRIKKRAVSWNKFFAGMNWKLRAVIAKEWKEETRAVMSEMGFDISRIKLPLIIFFKVKSVRPIDCDNNASSKLIIDWIKKEFKIEDTRKEIITAPSFPVKVKKPEEECVEVEIYDQDEIQQCANQFKRYICK